jgi:predicted nucleotidyltransferase/biotin operon repressor
MILEKESDINVLKNFCENAFDYFSIAEISERVKLSRNWVYKIIEKFEKYRILSKDRNGYKLDFSNTFCKRLKLLFDAEYISSLDKKTNEIVLNIANKLIFEIDPKSIVLVGSAASGKMRKESDLDLLVIGKGGEKIPYFENCNMILLSEEEFKEKYLKGDDFIISALLLGKIISDKNVFIRFYENPLPIFSRETIQEKINYCEKLEERIYALLRSDEKKAREELLYLALQSARIILLKNKVAPKTKYDIPSQVKPFNKNIAVIIEKLLEKKVKKEEMLECVKICAETYK